MKIVYNSANFACIEIKFGTKMHLKIIISFNVR